MHGRRIDDVRPGRPLVKPRALPHLAPYVPPAPKRPEPPVTRITPAKAGPQAPVVQDGMVRVATRPAQPRPHQPKLATAFIRPARPVPPPRPMSAAAPPSALRSDRQSPTPTEAVPLPAAKPREQPDKSPSKWRIAFELVQYPIIAVVALVAANNSTIGQWFVLAYAVVALVLRLRSQVSFGMALFLLVSIPVFQLLNQAGIAQNIAVYVYELLVVGTLQAVLELYKTRHHKRADA